MIEDCALERLGRARQSPRCPAIGIARTSVAAWVIMGEHDSCAAMLRGVGDDFAQRKVGSALIARVARQMEAVGVIVDVRHPQTFPTCLPIRKASRKKLARGLQAVELQGQFGTLIAHVRQARHDMLDPPFEPGSVRSSHCPKWSDALALGPIRRAD